MRTLAILTAAAALSACASSHTAPAQSFRPRGADAALQIAGKIDRSESFLTADHALTVTINGREAVSGSIGTGTRDLGGSFAGKPVAALCNRQGDMSGSYSIHCRIVVDGEFATTLTF